MDPDVKIIWKAETDGKRWSVWPLVDDGNPATDDELTEATMKYRRSLGIRRATTSTNRFDVTRDSKEAIDAWLKARGLDLTFDGIMAAQK